MVKTFFEQPAKRKKRQIAREEKAVKLNPRPLNYLRPIIHCPTRRYNMKVRYGRGFTIEELKIAGLNPRFARTIGISLDWRRQDTNLESRDLNVKRLKAYLSKLILFPSKTSRKLEAKAAKGEPMKDVKKEGAKPRKTLLPEATKEKRELPAAKEQIDDKIIMEMLEPKLREKPQSITPEMTGVKCFQKLRIERVKEKYAGKRKKKAEMAQKEAAEKATKEH
jgi:large subunit ribosomal protein L13e